MFKVNGNPIMASELSVLEELRSQLNSRGLMYLKDIRDSGSDIMVTCPFHKGGMERKPSMGISKDTMVCHCFTCGYAGYLTHVISDLFGFKDNGVYGKQWLMKNFLSLAIEDRNPMGINVTRKKEKKKINYVTEEELDKYRYIHPYMYERGLTDEIIERFDIGYDVSSDCITFPVLDLAGNCVFVARRSVQVKYFNYPRDVEKPVYAANLFVGGLYKTAVICESIFNCLTCWKFGIPAVALLGTGTEKQYKILREIPVKKYIIGTDGDDAGRRAADKLRVQLGSRKIITQWVIPEGKDINDLDSEILNIREIF